MITHELVHLIHPHRGAAFYELLEALMPDWWRRKERLERILP
jgi:predicted metal-dependent hydrolase